MLWVTGEVTCYDVHLYIISSISAKPLQVHLIFIKLKSNVIPYEMTCGTYIAARSIEGQGGTWRSSVGTFNFLYIFLTIPYLLYPWYNVREIASNVNHSKVMCRIVAAMSIQGQCQKVTFNVTGQIFIFVSIPIFYNSWNIFINIE